MAVDLTGLSWGTTHKGGISYGCYYKTSRVENNKKYYYKCSNFYSGQMAFGDESANEVICSRYLNKLGFNCLKYDLVFADIMIDGIKFRTHVCKSMDYFVGYESRTTLENLRKFNKDKKLEDIIAEIGINEMVKEMMLADFLVIQRDRHGGNIELLNNKGIYCFAPLFDNGLSFLAPYPSEFGSDVSNFNPLIDCPVNNYIGSRSLFDNLKYIDKPIKVNRLKKDDKMMIFGGLKRALPEEYINKIWEIIVYRYMYARKVGVLDDKDI